MYKALVHGSDVSEIVSVNRPNPDRIDMVSGSTVKAQTGSISSNGSFSVTWKHS